MGAFERAKKFFEACEAPEAPTGGETHSRYVYVLQLDADDKITHMTKVWNAGWAMRELGWA